MADLNEVHFTGRLGADAKLTYTQTGKARATARFAVGSVDKDRSGQIQSLTTWYTLLAWEKTAEMLAKLRKGQALYVKGSMRQRSYKGKDGQTKEYLELAIKRLAPLDLSVYSASPESNYDEVDLSDEEPAF